MKRLKARTLEVQTISGDLLLADTACDRVLAKSVSGDLQFGGPLAKAGRYEFNTHSGDVRLAVQGSIGLRDHRPTASAASSAPTFQLVGPQGDAAPTPAGDDDRQHGPRRQELRGTFGDGSALVVVQTFSGDVLVTGGAARKAPGRRTRRSRRTKTGTRT